MLVEAIDYIKRYSGATFVIKLGGETLLLNEVVESVAQDLILLTTLGINIVVVHGGGIEISKAMEAFGKKPTFVKGLRVTDKETVDIVEMVLTGKVNQQLVMTIHKMGGQAVGLSGKSGCLFEAKKRKGDVDLGFVGDIKKCNPKIVETQLAGGFIPVISPIAFSKNGDSMNINADTVAAEIASSLSASKLIILTNVDGVLSKRKKKYKRLTMTEVKKLIKDGTVQGGMIPKLNACIKALTSGVHRAHIVGASHHAVLEEILTKDGIGTMITTKKVR